MYLDQRGFVRACCMNVHKVLGNVGEQRLLDIWNGPVATELREAMARFELPDGCEICQWQVDKGQRELAYSRWFEHLEPATLAPDWPQQIEFSISNTCNLQCAMCNGEWSSSIRSQREKLPPLPKVYDEQFFDDLRAFLPHLRFAKFLGGEPFLANETLRIMEAMVEVGSTARSHVTTNGTQWSPRVERILDLMPVDVAVSLDAATKATYDTVRIGSDWDVVQRNLDRFQERAAANHTDVTLTYCLMTSNWHEFTDFCRLADDRGVTSVANLVTTPEHLSLYWLEPDELQEVVDAMEAQRAALPTDLTLSKGSWEGEVDKLRSHIDDRRKGGPITGLDVQRDDPVGRPFERSEQIRRLEQVDDVRQLVESRVGSNRPHLTVGEGDLITAVEPFGPVLGVEAEAILGRGAIELNDLLAAVHGAIVDVDLQEGPYECLLITVTFEGGRVLPFVAAPEVDDEGARHGTVLHVGELGEAPSGTPA